MAHVAMGITREVDVTDADDNGTTTFKFGDANHDVMKTAKLSVVTTTILAIVVAKTGSLTLMLQ